MYDPTLLVQVAFAWQGDVTLHSLMSSQYVPFPVNPFLQEQENEPTEFEHVAFA